MRVYEIRHENLMALYLQYKLDRPEDPERGMLKRFSESVGVNDRLMSHYKGNRKKLGHNVAQRIEEHLGLPPGWLDVPHVGKAAIDVVEHQFVRDALNLLRTDPRRAYRMLDEVEAGLPPPDNRPPAP